MSPRYFAAADLGASSGRVILGTLEDGRFTLAETIRFGNGPVPGDDGSIHTDARGLFEQIRAGIEIAIARSGGALESVGVDTWGVDYGRLNAAGELLEAPFHYRDDRTHGVPELVFAGLPAEQVYATAGLQVMAFNTIFQLVAGREDASWPEVSEILLTPDLMSYWLCGREVAEMTIASTTGLLDVATRTWSEDTCAHLAENYGLPVPRVLPELVEPGHGARHHDRRPVQRADQGGGRRRSRHRVGRRIDPCDEHRLRLHLLRHLVAGRARARGSRYSLPRAGKPTSRTNSASTAPSAT